MIDTRCVYKHNRTRILPHRDILAESCTKGKKLVHRWLSSDHLIRLKKKMKSIVGFWFNTFPLRSFYRVSRFLYTGCLCYKYAYGLYAYCNTLDFTPPQPGRVPLDFYKSQNGILALNSEVRFSQFLKKCHIHSLVRRRQLLCPESDELAFSVYDSGVFSSA